MADVAVEPSLVSSFDQKPQRMGPVWTTADIGYVFYIDSQQDLRYRKTSDGGATWPASGVSIHANTVASFDIWFDKWTPGDNGTVIHIWWNTGGTDDDMLYNSLDTSGDSLGSNVIFLNGSSLVVTKLHASGSSGTKAVGGNLYVQFWLGNAGTGGFYRSTDSGANWTSRTDGADGDATDYVLLFPDGVGEDTQDVVMIYWDRSADEISIKKYNDDDGATGSWAETLISTGMADDLELLQMDAVIRDTDSHIILVAWSEVASSTADLKCWDINVSTPSATVKANVVTNKNNCVDVSLFINQINDRLYCTYLGQDDGLQTWQTAVDVHYKSSDDGGLSWSSETTYSEDAADDVRLVRTGHSTPGSATGRFQPVFFNDDLNDLFVNTNNDIELLLGVTIPLPLRNKRLQSMADHPAMI